MLLSYFPYLPIIGFKFKGYTIFTEQLRDLHRKLMREYITYKQGDITRKEYLIRVKPLDIEIAKLEMATLQGTLVWQESFLQHALKPKH